MATPLTTGPERNSTAAGGVWKSLTYRSRVALLAPAAVMHPATRRALRARGLLDGAGRCTGWGRVVLRHRPAPPGAGPVIWLRAGAAARPVRDLHLPEPQAGAA